MRQVETSETMWMRFELQERAGDQPFARVRIPGLGVWRKSRPAVPRFVHRQQVRELAEGLEYRGRVQFRWFDSGGNVVKKAVRRSASCREGGELPNLAVEQIRGKPVTGSAGFQRYEVRVGNRGRAAVTGASVSVSVDGAAVDTVAVGALEPGETRQLFVNGPACKGSARAEVDPTDTVIETSESDNVLKSRCPLRP